MGAEKKWLYTLFLGAFITFLIFSSFISGFGSSYYYAFPPSKQFSSTVDHGPGRPPSFAFYISGKRGDGDRLYRLLLAVYHPRNRYLLHISADGSDEERVRLGEMVKSFPAVRAFGNVDVIGKPDPNTYMGSTNLAAILRAVAILLKVDEGWDWFISLSATDYPLITQDDLSHVFSSIRRDLNFIDHTSELGWKESQRIQPIVVDPGIYLARKTQIFHATQKRSLPDAFTVFTGSPWVVLSRPFLEFCAFGWDNLPRTLLMYFTNVVLSEEVYFHTVICNSPEFSNTTVNADLRFFIWDDPPKMEPHVLSSSDYEEMVKSGAAFARQFEKDSVVLDMIDRNILKRNPNRATPGAWCRGRRSWWMDPCSQWGDVNAVKPGPQANKFGNSIDKLLDGWNERSDMCVK
ncbi:beta-glucuronosyltransferase GlcAT14A-like [Salvia hispanica]|uniref:beta-glucuronosyltransferase GlcAT14A-like n=1 Tax=Salvia hispanica TaxID=49212 RepID=UPI00200912AF|nr:beta-glucuronosyltransferase GlcAT14A-like [Salvia hispanica]